MREQSNQVKQIRVGSLERQLEENYKDLFHTTRLTSHEVKMLKEDVVAAKESPQSVRERNRSLAQVKDNSRGQRRRKFAR